MKKLSFYATILLIGDSHSYQTFGRHLDALLRTLPDTQVATVASWGSQPDSWYNSWVTDYGLFEHDPDGRVTDVQSGATPQFEELVARFHPRLTVIALGSNLYGAPPDWSEQVTRRMAATAVGQLDRAPVPQGGGCLWVGPPDMRSRGGPDMDALEGVLQRASAPMCRYFDSRTVTRYPATGGDGIHYDYLGDDGVRQAQGWAAAVFRSVQGSLGTH